MAFDSRPPSRYLPAYITSQDLRAEKRRIREGKKNITQQYVLPDLAPINKPLRARENRTKQSRN